MDAVSWIQRLHQHRMWVNAKLKVAATSLDESQLRATFSIGQGSIWKSLLHLYAAEFVWLEALQGNESPLIKGDLPGRIPGNQLADGGIATLKELISEWDTLDLRWQIYLTTLTSQMLDQIIYKTSTSSGLGKRFGTRCGDVLLHVCTHAQYTTAQVVNMFRQAGATTSPDVMLITMARQEAI